MIAPTSSTRKLAPWHERRFLALDLETTGVDREKDRIVSTALAIVNAQGGVDSSYYDLVRQDAPIPAEATKIHGITTERCEAEGQPLAVVVHKVFSSLEWAMPRGVPLVIMNAQFDWSFLHAEAARLTPTATVPPALILDPLVIDRKVDQFRKGSRKLPDLVRQYGIDPDTVAGEFHDARKDCVLAALAMRGLAQAFFSLQASTLEALYGAQSLWFREWRDQINNYWRTNLIDKRVEGEWPA